MGIVVSEKQQRMKEKKGIKEDGEEKPAVSFWILREAFWGKEHVKVEAYLP